METVHQEMIQEGLKTRWTQLSNIRNLESAPFHSLHSIDGSHMAYISYQQLIAMYLLGSLGFPINVSQDSIICVTVSVPITQIPHSKC